MIKGIVTRTIIISFSLLLTPIAFSADWKEINGIYAVTSQGYLDPAEDEPIDSHYRIQLKGQSAKDLYNAMQVEASIDECTGASGKSVQQMQCLYFDESDTYECHFSIDITKQEIQYGVAC